MNRDKLTVIRQLLSEIKDAHDVLQIMHDEEEEAFNYLPAFLRLCEQGERMDEALDALDEAVDALDDAATALEDAAYDIEDAWSDLLDP
ncbi:MAG: hypothetical protein J6T94_08535 [Bacteroidaceae bacterium]|nr:hypothetical protein [Bacteroidaceae bacterium]